MRAFTYQRAATPATAAEAFVRTPGARFQYVAPAEFEIGKVIHVGAP